MSDEPVLYTKDGYITTITLNRPENRNSMTPDVLAAFKEAILKVRNDNNVRVLIITGSGKSFCAGADFSSGGTLAGRDKLSTIESYEHSKGIYQPFLGILEIEVPVIAAMNGHAIGGGLGLAVVCDMRIASTEARYGANFARLGLHSGMSISYLLPRLIGVPKAAEFLFSGTIMSGQEAADCGLANYAVTPDQVMAEARKRADIIAGNGPQAVKLIKQSFYRNLNWDPRSAAIGEAWAQSATMSSQDSTEGIAALLEKRDPVFTGK